ncbi:hypothetical protein ACJX0J_033040 [Zea mays]
MEIFFFQLPTFFNKTQKYMYINTLFLPEQVPMLVVKDSALMIPGGFGMCIAAAPEPEKDDAEDTDASVPAKKIKVEEATEAKKKKDKGEHREDFLNLKKYSIYEYCCTVTDLWFIIDLLCYIHGYVIFIHFKDIIYINIYFFTTGHVILHVTYHANIQTLRLNIMWLYFVASEGRVVERLQAQVVYASSISKH